MSVLTMLSVLPFIPGRPKTLALRRNPKYPRRAIPRKQVLDKFSIVQYPLTTGTFNPTTTLPTFACV